MTCTMCAWMQPCYSYRYRYYASHDSWPHSHCLTSALACMHMSSQKHIIDEHGDWGCTLVSSQRNEIGCCISGTYWNDDAKGKGPLLLSIISINLPVLPHPPPPPPLPHASDPDSVLTCVISVAVGSSHLYDSCL